MNYELRIRNFDPSLYPSPGPPQAERGWGRGRIAVFAVFIFGIALGLLLRDWLDEKEAAAKVITIKSRNLEFQVATRAKTIGEVLGEQNYLNHNSSQPPLTLRGGVPPLRVRGGEGELRIVNGITIEIRVPLTLTLTDAGNPREIQTQAETVGDLLNKEKIGLAATDQVKPPLESYLAEGTSVIIDRIVDLATTEINEIAYEIKLELDPEIYYGREEILRTGVLGKKEQEFLITYKNGVEVKRKLLREKILAKPQAEIRKFGTKIEIENIEEGRASWYAYKKCLCAAHPYYEFGRYVRVTSLATGKSLLVKINDRGPQQAIHPERVIDLDAAAFRELAPLSAGTIAVKVELLK